MARLIRIACVLAICAACASSGHLSVARRAQRIEGQVWSPYCPGKLLIDCTTVQAGQLRARIAHEVRAGRTDAAVLNQIREDFGDEALARPPAGRAGLFIWLIPVVVLALGLIAVVTVVRRRAPPPVASSSPDDPAIQRLRDEVRRDI